jgi:hypothetical protein
MIFAEKLKAVSGLAPVATNGNPASAYVDCSRAHSVKVVAHVTKGNAALTSFAIEQATTAGGGGNKPLANNVPVWSNLDAATSDTLVRRANGVSYALNNGAAHRQVVVFDVDTSKLDINGGFRFLRVQTAAGDAANVASVMFYLDQRATA